MTVEAVRKLSDIDFNSEGAHIALTSKSINGGPANKRTTLLFKGQTEIKKEEVQVKMDIVEFMRVFFNMWTGDAATLASILGMETDYFDDDFTFEEFNTLGDTEVTLLKAASAVEKTEDSLSAYVNDLPSEDLNTLKAFAESFNKKLQEHNNMSTELEKALEAKEVELQKAFEAKLEEAVAVAKADGEAAKAKLEEINKAAALKVEAEFIEKAVSFGADEDLGVAMAVLSATEQGAMVIKALEDAHKRLDEVVEKEAGFTGEAVEGEADTSIMKAMKNKYDTNS